MKKLVNILLMLLPVLVWADDAELGGLHCGDVVTITATPDEGYRFVRWSDGNTDNPREIEITDAVTLSAVYEPLCRQDEVPVVWLYNQLMMINADSLERMGYTFTEQGVSWYRIVGDIDMNAAATDDELVSTGYYYNLPSGQMGVYYAAVDVGATAQTAPPRCSDVLYSKPIRVGQTDLMNTRDDEGDPVRKVIYNNQLYIIRHDRIYRADGSEVGQVAGCRWQVAGCRWQVAGDRLQVAGDR